MPEDPESRARVRPRRTAPAVSPLSKRASCPTVCCPAALHWLRGAHRWSSPASSPERKAPVVSSWRKDGQSRGWSRPEPQRMLPRPIERVASRKTPTRKAGTEEWSAAPRSPSRRRASLPRLRRSQRNTCATGPAAPASSSGSSLVLRVMPRRELDWSNVSAVASPASAVSTLMALTAGAPRHNIRHSIISGVR